MTFSRSVFVLLLACSPAAAQLAVHGGTPQSQPSEDAPRVVKMTLRPAAAASPALKYTFLPTAIDQVPGNAMTLYYIAMSQAPSTDTSAIDEKISDWLKTPLKDLPPEEVRNAADTYRGAIIEVELAAKRDRCEWDLPVREQGINLILPSLGKYRAIAKVLALEARLLIAQGRNDEAIAKLRTGFAMARDVAEGPTLINALVGGAICAIMTGQVEQLIQAPDAPNVYWALTALPQPLIDLRKGMDFETNFIYIAFPNLRKVGTDLFSAEDWTGTVAVASSMLSDRHETQLAATLLAVQIYPEAKKYMLSRGYTAEQVQAMPVQKVVAAYTLDGYLRMRDEVFKWYYLPYWQAREELEKVDGLVREARGSMQGFPFTDLLPSLSRAYMQTTLRDRDIAALRVIEAIRIYAAGHEGRLPATLSDIKEVPIPLNPMFGEPFRYAATGNTAVLEAPALLRHSGNNTRYEITMTK